MTTRSTDQGAAAAVSDSLLYKPGQFTALMDQAGGGQLRSGGVPDQHEDNGDRKSSGGSGAELEPTLEEHRGSQRDSTDTVAVPPVVGSWRRWSRIVDRLAVVSLVGFVAIWVAFA